MFNCCSYALPTRVGPPFPSHVDAVRLNVWHTRAAFLTQSLLRMAYVELARCMTEIACWELIGQVSRLLAQC